MINRKLCIAVCCLGVGLSLVARAQPASGSSDDQAKALEALRQAEKGRLMATHPVVPATAVTPAPASDAETAKAIEALRHAERGAPVAAPAATATAPAAAATAATSNPEEDAKALEALRQAEKSRLNTPQVVNIRPATSAPAVVASTPTSEENARSLEALRHAENNGSAGQKTSAQREADAARERQALADSQAAARSKKVNQDRNLVALGRQEDADTAAATAALEQFQKNMPVPPVEANRRAAATALDRQKAQEEVARRVEGLQAQIKSQPAGSTPTSSGISMSKEERLRELLRRYNADEITPLEYHSERAKIISEP